MLKKIHKRNMPFDLSRPLNLGKTLEKSCAIMKEMLQKIPVYRFINYGPETLNIKLERSREVNTTREQQGPADCLIYSTALSCNKK